MIGNPFKQLKGRIMSNKEEELRSQINDIIEGEIQNGINDYIETEGGGFGKDDQLKVKISQSEVEKILKEYKRIKKNEKSNLGQVKKLGLIDKNGRPL